MVSLKTRRSDGGHGAEPTQDEGRWLPHESGDHQDPGRDIEDDLDDLEVPLDGAALGVGPGGVDVVQRREEAVGAEDHDQDHEPHGHPLNQLREIAGNSRNQGYPVVEHQRPEPRGRGGGTPSA